MKLTLYLIYICAVIFSLIILANASNKTCYCGLPHSLTPRIVNGVLPTQVYPWMAVILRFDEVMCGGSVINNRFILTAAHCAKSYKIHELIVALGVVNAHHLDAHVQKFGNLRATIHPEFKQKHGIDTHDIALLKLPRDIVFNQYVAPICLPTSVSKLYVGVVATVAGWGQATDHSAPTKQLMEAHVTVVDNHSCSKTKLGHFVQPTNMCAYYKGVDACQGDSGGPLFYPAKSNKYEQIGIVSWGMRCATAGVPGVYTRVTHYTHWIHAHTKHAVYCQPKN